MSFPRGVNQTYCSPRMKRREREWTKCVVFYPSRQCLISFSIQEVIYFDSYLTEFYFIQMKSHCCELNKREGEEKEKQRDSKESTE